MLPVTVSTIFSFVLGFLPGVFFIKSSSSKSQVASVHSLSDEEIIFEYNRSSDKEYIGVLFERYVHLVFASCMKYMKDEESARDAAMEIFESLTDKLLKYKIEHFKSWLYTTTRNYCLMEFRKKKPVDRMDNENFDRSFMEIEDFLHPNIREKEEEYAMLLNYLSELNQEQKICIELMYLKELSYKEIASETGYEINNVKSYIQNGKRNLRIMLEQYYEKQRGI